MPKIYDNGSLYTIKSVVIHGAPRLPTVEMHQPFWENRIACTEYIKKYSAHGLILFLGSGLLSDFKSFKTKNILP